MRAALFSATAVAAIAAAAPASATALNVSSGFSPFYAFQTTTGSKFVDTFTFTTTADHSISATINTQSLMIGAVTFSDLDFLSVMLDDLTFTPRADNTDQKSAFDLSAVHLGAGSHTLTVTYKVDAALAPAGYSGSLVLGAPGAVPEPATWGMFVTAFGAVGGILRRRRRQQAALG